MNQQHPFLDLEKQIQALQEQIQALQEFRSTVAEQMQAFQEEFRSTVADLISENQEFIRRQLTCPVDDN